MKTKPPPPLPKDMFLWTTFVTQILILKKCGLDSLAFYLRLNFFLTLPDYNDFFVSIGVERWIRILRPMTLTKSLGKDIG